jgi:hypothetical protein
MSYKRIQYLFLKSILQGALLLFATPIISQADSSLKNTPTKDTIVTESKFRSYKKGDIPADTISGFEEADSSKKKKHTKSPKIAAISSSILPGLGQAYNRKYYKIPIIYGAGTIMYYYFDRYNYNYQRLKKARKELTETGAISDPELESFDKASLEENMNNFRRNRDYQIIFMGLLYVANIVDAMVDAHMYEFDVSEDLTMKISPSFTPLPAPTYTASAGLRLSFRF